MLQCKIETRLAAGFINTAVTFIKGTATPADAILLCTSLPARRISLQAVVKSEIEESFLVEGGVRIHYQRLGDGRPLLLIHGLVGSARNWRHNITALAGTASVYAIDLLNMGESDRVPGLDVSLEAIADRVAAIMGALGLDEADVAGHSHGGAVAMMLSARHPSRVRKLILFAPANPFCDLGRQLIRFYKTRPGTWFARMIPSLPTVLKTTALGRMYGDPSRVTMEALEGYTAGLGTPGTVDHVLQIVRRWYLDMSLLRAALPRLASQPILLIWGDRDRAVGLESGRQLLQILPLSKLIVIPGAGHIPFEEMPDICNQAMRDWLADPMPEAPAFAMRYPNENLCQLKAG
jgi:4,5:9,10-diseco-3-hydroxy-5,9,17-trioxoandrosta-1(10),2-diene-4-oate hydrolase